MCLLEAKAFCIPIVSFNIRTGPNEMIDHGRNGYLIPPFDCQDMAKKLALLMEDDSLREQFGAHAQDHIDKFQMKYVLNQWNQVLQRLLPYG